jgi:hypothetical protein
LKFTFPDFYSLKALGDWTPFLRHMYIVDSVTQEKRKSISITDGGIQFPAAIIFGVFVPLDSLFLTTRF